MYINTIVALTVQFGSLLGVAALVAALVNVLKVFGVVKDGTSQYWASGFSLVLFVVMVVLGIFRPDLTAVFVNDIALKIATVLTFVLGFVTTIVAAPFWHNQLSAGSVPIIGKSFTS
ncbi:MAG: hypothetical protein Q7U34_01745 [Anaerolineales bacterium]|nr:hypothetical protein [Anaerolineales bacterium]MDO9348726.1 hypothetical protein [Anaerolineales bacterium]MDP3186318.1 hypothetical protein [Anaerolineales bacterium]